jgi:hypothetical protein
MSEQEKESLENPCPTATPPWILQQKKLEQEKNETKEEPNAAE